MLTAPNLAPYSDSVVLGAGTEIVVDDIAACRNARHFPNPEAYEPTRWASADTAAIDNFVAFGGGPRMCLGRKFSTVEAVCFLSNMLRDWRFDVKLENGETPEQWRERVMQPEIAISLKIGALTFAFAA